ncbi:MAG: histidinol-phosphate transaminase [Candidatus Omnitrophica bacterium]|nr:histidinol-phosphate transaminase [Candidatus Omnitrophota bacterium]MBU4333162.1 histidinol-phosphate transaminase [Candidatus Omnitrophota bacterium]
MKSVAKKTIFSIKPYIPGKPISEVKRELGLKEVIKLASNENPYPPSPKVLKAITQAAKEVNRYPDGDCFYLRSALAKRLKVNPRQLIFSNGSDELIVMAVRAFVDNGDEVIIAKPSFLIYEIASKIEGANIKNIPLKDFSYDLDSMKKAVTKKTKIIFLGNPDNPSGTYLKDQDVAKFLRGLRKDILVFFDEAYYEYVDEKDYVDSLGLLKNYKNVIVTRTFSKMYGLAGLRIGYGIANLELVDILNRIREPFNVNSIAQVAALACLNENAYYKDIAKKVKDQREFLYKSFDRLGLEFKKSYTNFILINVKSDSTLVSQKLLKKGVIVRDMSSWGVKNFIRVSIGTQKENKKFIKVLGEIL